NFSIQYDCNDGITHDGTATLAAGGETTISGIPTGTSCVVTEPTTPTAPAGWTFGTDRKSVVQGNSDDVRGGSIAKGRTYTVGYTNTFTRNTRSKKITRPCNPLASGSSRTFSIHYDCNDGTTHDGTATLAAGAYTTISGIPTGTSCVVTEPTTPTAPAGWTFG